MCSKLKYSDVRSAYKALKETALDPNPQRREQSFYRCPHCKDCYHLTSKPFTGSQKLLSAAVACQ